MWQNKPVAPMVLFAMLTILIVADQVIAQAPAAPVIGCSFPNTSMISTTACTQSDYQSSLPGLMGCLPYLEGDEATPSLKCCNGVRNMSASHTPCLCKVTFYPPTGINVTSQRLMPGLCNVTTDFCSVCPAYLVHRVAENSSESSDDEIQKYKKKVIGLAVVLALVMAGVVAAVSLVIRKKLKGRKTDLKSKTSFQSRHPGGDF